MTDEDWTVKAVLHPDFSLIDETKIKGEHFIYHEEDAFASDDCLRDDVRGWLDANMQKRWSSYCLYGAEVLTIAFEFEDDAVLFKLRW